MSKVVPVPAVNEGVDALIQGRADVTTHAIGSAKVKEADAAVGIRYIPLDCSPARRRAHQEGRAGLLPFHRQSRVIHPGIVEDTCAYTLRYLFRRPQRAARMPWCASCA